MGSLITSMLFLWIMLLKRTECTSCSCHNVCQIVSKFDEHLTKVESDVESRTPYIKKIDRLEEKFQDLENNNQDFRRGKSFSSPEPLTKKVSEDLNILRTKAKIMEKALRYVVSFLGSKDEKEVESLKNEVKKDDDVDKDFKALFSKVVADKRKEVKMINDRLKVLEDRVSKCEKRDLESASNFRNAARAIDERLTRQATLWDKRLQDLESKYDSKLADLGAIPKQIEGLYKEGKKQESSKRTLSRKLQQMLGKLQNMETTVVSNIAKTSTNLLEDFKEEWGVNCTKGIAPCYFIEIKEPSYYGNRTWNHVDEKESFEKSEDFWGCKPLRLSDYPHVVTTREEDRQTIRFHCKDGHMFVGIDFMKCLQNGVWIGREEPPECPEK